MSFSRLHKLVAYLLSGLGLLALSLGTELSPFVSGWIFLAFGVSYFVEGPIIHSKNYATAWTSAVVALLAVQAARAILVEPTLALMLEFAAFLQLSRLFNRRAATDYQQIAVLAFLHLIAATVLSSSLGYALVFVGFVIATPWMLALSHLRREIEGNYPESEVAGGEIRTAIARVLASKRVVGSGFLVGTALLSLPLFAMTLAIFFMVPRVGQGFLSFDRSQGDKVAGFGNQVELGGFGVIRDDPSVVLRVTPLPSIDKKAPRVALRLRGTSFDHYDGRRWTRSPGEQRPFPRFRDGSFILRRATVPADQRYRILLEELAEPVVFIPEGTVALRVDPRIVRAETVQRRLDYASGLDVRYRPDDDLGLMYEAFVSHDRDEHAIVPLSTESRDVYLQLPEGHEQVAALARQLTAGVADPLQMASRLRAFLRSSEFTYSLEMPHVEKDEYPLEVFLLRARRGHCEYFSTAMAVMLRMLGVPARNVTGFVGGHYNAYGDYYALRQGDAHSWVEVFVDGRGWLTFDPTPSARAAVGRGQSLWADAHAIMDALRTRWMTSVVGYDLRTQLRFMRRLASWAARRGSREPEPDAATEPDRALVAMAKRGLAWFVVVSAITVVFVLWFRRRGPRDGIPPEQADVVRLYRDLERALVQRGKARPPAATPLEHAESLAEQRFPQAAEVMDVTEGYVLARYGGAPPTAAELLRLRQAVTRVRRARPTTHI